MKAGQLFKRFHRQRVERDIEEELRWHLEMLTQEQLHQDMSLAEARDAALKRFGNVEQIKDQCVKISRRNQPFLRAVTPSLIVVVIVGVLARIYGTNVHVRHFGDLLIAISILSRLLLYVRGLNPSSFFSKPETSSPLKLISDK
jgi:hypothetical protein